MIEKRLVAVPPQSFTVDGDPNGKITIASADLFKVKQIIVIANNTLSPLELEVKRIVDINTLYVGPLKQNIDMRQDLSGYTVASGAFIFANEQKRPSVPQEEIVRAVYEEEPTVATRVILVDKMGDKVDLNNPLPITGNITVSTQRYDDVKLSYDSDDDIVLVRKYLATVLMRTQQLIYDSNKNLIEIKDI